MPRIGEALARAGGGTPGAPQPAAGADLSSIDPVFLPDPQESTQAPTAAAPEPPLPSEPALPPAVVSAPPHAVVLEDLHGLRLAEKFTPTSRHSGFVEQYRRLAARLHLTQSQQHNRVVMVTSAVPGEGKTLTAANLALTLSESYHRRVLLVDADLRRPWLHELFQVPNVTGLNDGLRSEDERKVPVIHLTQYLSLLTAGRPDPDPMGVLSSPRMRRILEDADAAFDWVIIDTPPIGLLPDAHLLSTLVHSVLLVVQAAKTPLAAINATVKAIGRDRILGVVLNRAQDAPTISYSDYYSRARA